MSNQIIKNVSELLYGNKAVAAATEDKETKKSEFWLNVGVEVPHPENEGETMFINLPLFCPLDDLKPSKIQGSEKQRQFLAAKNALLESFMEMVHGVKVGETLILDKPFVIQVNHADLRSEEAKAAEANVGNSYLTNLRSVMNK